MYRTNEIPQFTLEFAQEFLGDSYERKLAHNTYVHGPRASVTDGVGGRIYGYGVTLHQTMIYFVSDCGRFIRLDTRGWRSVTTRQRLQQLLPRATYSGSWSDDTRKAHGVNVRLSSEKGRWHIGAYCHDTNDHWWHPYSDGIVLDTQAPACRPTPGSLKASEYNLFATAS